MIRLLQVAPENRDDLRRWRNAPEVSRYMYTTHQISAGEHAAWFERLLTAADRKAWIVSMDGHGVGAVFLTDIDPDNSRATWAFYLADPRTRGRGVGSATEFLLLDIVFVELGLQKLSAEVLSFNQPVLEMHKKFGFVEEGCLRRHWYRDGEWLDVHVIAQFRDSWLERRDAFAEKLMARGLI